MLSPGEEVRGSVQAEERIKRSVGVALRPTLSFRRVSRVRGQGHGVRTPPAQFPVLHQTRPLPPPSHGPRHPFRGFTTPDEPVHPGGRRVWSSHRSWGRETPDARLVSRDVGVVHTGPSRAGTHVLTVHTCGHTRALGPSLDPATLGVLLVQHDLSVA